MEEASRLYRRDTGYIGIISLLRSSPLRVGCTPHFRCAACGVLDNTAPAGRSYLCFLSIDEMFGFFKFFLEERIFYRSFIHKVNIPAKQ